MKIQPKTDYADLCYRQANDGGPVQPWFFQAFNSKHRTDLTRLLRPHTTVVCCQFYGKREPRQCRKTGSIHGVGKPGTALHKQKPTGK